MDAINNAAGSGGPDPGVMTPVARAALALAVDCRLGEGLVWDARRACWWWTDIQQSCLYAWDGRETPPKRRPLPQRLGSFAVARSGQLLLGLAKGLAMGSLEGDGVTVTAITAIEPGIATRINDGRVDRSGRFVFGTLHEADERAPVASFYQYSVRHGVRRLGLPAVRIANSICFSPDGRTMYFTDSPSGLIQRCAYDSDRAEVGPPMAFARVAAPGLPDGSVVDADGCVWNAQWGLGVVSRYSPQGTLLAQVQVDAPHVTCPAFGGPALDTMMVASAREELTPQALQQWPGSGGLFACPAPGCHGLPDALFDDGPGA